MTVEGGEEGREEGGETLAVGEKEREKIKKLEV